MIKSIEEAVSIVQPWLGYETSLIIQSFLSQRDAQSCGDGDYQSVYIPGMRKDRVLLVAHCDTVNSIDQHRVETVAENGIIRAKDHRTYRTKKGSVVRTGCPIGADDRAGCAILWDFIGSGHSILLTNGEEEGCLSSHYRMGNEEMAQEIQNHQFAIQFDRKGRNDIVFYDVGTPEFVKYVTEQTGYKEASGSSTDICVLCENICGVNISIGFKNEHTRNEILNVRNWMRTYNIVKRWIYQQDLPKFER